MAEFVPLDGPEIIEAVLADIRLALESRHDMFGKHLTYPRADWTFQIEFDFYHSDEVILGEGSKLVPDAPAVVDPTPLVVTKRRKVHAPDQVREELLGKSPQKEDKGESANALSSPQNDGIIRITRP